MLSFKSCALRSVHVPLPVSLQWLILTDNRLAELPHQIGELVLMRKLMLSNNRALHTLMMCMLCDVYITARALARALRVHCVCTVYALCTHATCALCMQGWARCRAAWPRCGISSSCASPTTGCGGCLCGKQPPGGFGPFALHPALPAPAQAQRVA